jgi:D-alanine--poly(phosphoribitol) ligase subunit 1
MLMFSEHVLSPFINLVERLGVNNAFCINEKFYAYDELAQHISKIRKALQSTGFAGKNIGLVANDDIDTYASIFAIWLEGLAYVPLHPQQPVERSLEIISQAAIDLVVNSNNKNIFPAIKTIESSALEFNELIIEPFETNDNALAYILFTSGSTGKPKGVPITRGNVGAFMKAFWETGLLISDADRCLQAYELTFDLSVQSYLVPLTRGACTYTVPLNQIKYSYVYGLLDDHQLTFLPMPPSLIRFLRPYFDEINYSCVRYNLLGAEASQVELIKEWSACIPKAEIYNFYGPTEATIYCTYSHFDREKETKNVNGLMMIGKPMNGISTIILDDKNNIAGENTKGELCVSGEQLTAGYLNNPERNQQVFFEINYNGNMKRFYRTGDLCYKDAEGDIMYCGRLDYQVKVQGYRIELGEIEFHAREFLQGRNAIAVTFDNKIQNTEIALFVEGRLQDKELLVNYLKSKIPSYMIPSKILCAEVFPLNTNAKVDRIALKKMIDF